MQTVKKALKKYLWFLFNILLFYSHSLYTFTRT